jgi:hypothetical protein
MPLPLAEGAEIGRQPSAKYVAQVIGKTERSSGEGEAAAPTLLL